MVKVRNLGACHIVGIPIEVKYLFEVINIPKLRGKHTVFTLQFEEKEMRVKSVTLSRQGCVL